MTSRRSRREVITLLGGAAAAAWPLAARAQQAAKIARVGILNYAAAQDIRVGQFLDALRRLGYVEGKNFTVIHRWANGALDRLPELAAELVASKVDVIIALGPAVWAAKRATTTVPIVIAFSGDPVGDGVVSSLARPGGNLTGFSYMSTDLAAKRLELLSNAFSKNRRIGILYNPQEPATRLEMRESEAAAKLLGVTLQPLAAAHPDDLTQAFTAAMREPVDALLVFTHGFAVLHRARIMELAARHRLPTLYGWRDFVDEGGLMSYGPDIEVLVRQAASYVDRIVRGEKPGDLPVEQPTRLRLHINLKTAKALGLDVPPTLLARADEVIE
jgi:putative ABC transport system substrate-binding protein